MAIRGLRRVLRCCDCGLRTGLPILASQRRAFTSSNTRRKHGAVPKFTEASSKELVNLLSTMRENVFLPAHLSKPHRNLVFGARHRKVLEEDPVIVDVAGENFLLKHIDRTKDQPGTVEALREFVSLMKECWQNGRTKIFRDAGPKAGQAGRQVTILECVRRASRTGFVLKDLSLVREIMWWIQYKPLSTEWNAQSTKKALKMAEQIAILLEDEKHSGGTLRGTSDPRARPEVVGVLLQLAAMHSRLSGGKDEDGKVEVYARRLLGTLAGDVDLWQDLPVEKRWWACNALLCYVSPILHGMREAVEILGSDSATTRSLQKRERDMRDIASSVRESLREEIGDASRLGVWCYEKLIGTGVA